MEQYTHRDWVPPNGRFKNLRRPYTLEFSENISSPDDEEKYGSPLLPAANFQLKGSFRCQASGAMSSATAISSYYLISIGSGNIIRDQTGGNATARYEEEYQRFIMRIYALPGYDSPLGLGPGFQYHGDWRIRDGGIFKIPEFYHVVYDPTQVDNLPTEMRRFPKNRVLGRIHDASTLYTVDWTLGPTDSYQTSAEITYEAVFPSIGSNQMYAYEDATYVNRGGVTALEFSNYLQTGKRVGFEIPEEAKISLFFIAHYETHLFSVRHTLNIRTLYKKGSSQQSDCIYDRQTSRALCMTQDNNKNVVLLVSNKFQEEAGVSSEYLPWGKPAIKYSSMKGVASRGKVKRAFMAFPYWDQGYGNDFSVCLTSDSHFVIVYKKWGKAVGSLKDSDLAEFYYRNSFPQGVAQTGIFLSFCPDLSNNLDYLDYIKKENSNERLDFQVTETGSDPVAVYDRQTSRLYIFYWDEKRLEYPEAAKARDEELFRDFYAKVSYEHSKSGGNTNLDINKLRHQHSLTNRPVLAEHIFVGKSDGTTEFKKDYVKSGSIFVKVLTLSFSGDRMVVDSYSPNPSQPTEQRLKYPVEDFLVFPCPRTETIDIPRQKIGATQISDGLFYITLKDKNKNFYLLLVNITNEGCTLKYMDKIEDM